SARQVLVDDRQLGTRLRGCRHAEPGDLALSEGIRYSVQLRQADRAKSRLVRVDDSSRAPMTPVALEAIGVAKSYATREALHDVDLVARRGEIHGLLGPNGAGKTTLLRVLLGLVRPDTGRVRLLGRDLAAGSALPNGVSGLIDVPAFYPYMS